MLIGESRNERVFVGVVGVVVSYRDLSSPRKLLLHPLRHVHHHRVRPLVRVFRFQTCA